MIRMTNKHFDSLNYGDKVYKCENGRIRSLRFVGLDPTSPAYCIFCDGIYLTSFYSRSWETSNIEWFIGDYDSKFLGEVLLKQLDKRIKTVNKVYLKKII